MAYFKPYIDEAGPHIPLYSDIRDELLERAKGIFGDDIYLDIDSQDYQMIAVIAELANDINEMGVHYYNNRGPATAIGSGLDGVVKMNGIKRKGMTHSICPLIIKGDPGTKIYDGIAADGNDERWFVGSVIIPEAGSIEVTATCMRSGPVYADINTIIRIVTQTRGWMSVTNPVNATPGRDTELDSTLRSRQAISTANPSKTVLQGIVGGIAALLNVTRYRVYENDTNLPDENGIPGNRISVVVEGGEDAEIANIIYLRKTPGGGTYGDVAVQVEPPDEFIDNPKPVRFFRPGYVDVYVEVRIRKLTGFVSQIPTDIQQNICNYLNSLEIGENLTVSALYAPANAATPNIYAPLFSIQSLTIGRTENSLSVEDMVIDFNQVTRGVLEHIRVTVL